MRPLSEELVVRAIDTELLSHGFEPRSVPSVDGAPVVALWTRKTWNTNRAAVVLRLEPAAQPGPLSQRMKIPLGKAIGYFPFFYGLGLQLVWVGRDVTLEDDLSSYVDKIDNQRSIVQSLFVVDLVSCLHHSHSNSPAPDGARAGEFSPMG